MTVIDPAFEGAGQETGLQIWRIEAMEVKPLDVKSYGTFYSGDSYILLHTKKSRGGTNEWHIHFWLGKDTSQDESTVAAIKSVELDDVLGGSPVQHREVEGHESEVFLSYFKKGVRYLDGGVASGFHHVEDQVIKRLLQVKGKRNVRIFQVPASVDSMNKGDCFILDCGPRIYLYVGETSGRIERLKAIQAANGIRDDIHGGRSVIEILDDSCSANEKAKFFEELGSGSENDVKDATEGGDDLKYERTVESEISLHRISDEDGSLKVEQIAVKPLKQDLLETDNCFLLDGGVGALFVWVGKKASQEERVQSMKMAEKYLEVKGYPKSTSVTRVIECGEPPLFKQYFGLWKEPEDQVGLGRVFTQEQIAATPEFDVRSLHAEKRRHMSRSLGKSPGFMPDDGSGNVEILRVENFELCPIDSSTYGMFFGGDSYVLKYTYESERSTRYIIYFWQGLRSSQDERAASAIWAVKLDNELCGKAIQVRVVQGQEPEHFLRIFKGKMVIFMGGHASGFKNIHDHDTYDVDGTRMFHIKGTNEINVRAVQVPEATINLCSDDVFVLETPSATYVWNGKNSNEEEQNYGRNMASVLSPKREATVLSEGSETEDFWSSIGGEGQYQETKGLSEKPLLSPRLFKCSDHSGRFRVEEICHFEQQDLSEDDVMILDTGDEIFIWVGKGASEEEKSTSSKLAEDYVKTDPTERTMDNTIIITIKQGEEPFSFKSLFDSWNTDLWNEMKSYDQLKAEIQEQNLTL